MRLSASEDVFEQFKPVFDHMVNSSELNSSGFKEAPLVTLEDKSEDVPLGDFDGGGSATQSPSFQQEGIDWVKMCNDSQTALVSSCDVLVNPDNTLTTEGERAVGCIRNGIVLAGGGSLLLSLPLPLAVTALQVLEEPTGCGGIVEWGLIGDTDDLRGIIDHSLKSSLQFCH